MRSMLGNKYIMTILEYASRYVIPKAIPQVTAEEERPRRRNRVRARRADGRVAELLAGMDARGLNAAAQLTLRGIPHTRIRAEPGTMERGSKEH
ncbi:hypothetical protein EVAR_90991_1 [Eumeta japonica]|uniref:Uncharacterized protein n=1 Tax=Eumeta variegata TaxID=151549 RepID=A0A4C1Z3Y1_EUMVA|nr:hypothetical protein EVAR_90991_1 [Eumeta japonica]